MFKKYKATRDELVKYVAESVREGLRGLIGAQRGTPKEPEVGDVVSTTRLTMLMPDNVRDDITDVSQGVIGITTVFCPADTLMLILEIDDKLAYTMLLEDGSTGWINLETLAVYE